MKKTVLLLIFIIELIASSVMAQTQEPSKQDAMDFIAKKFAANIVSPRRFHSYNNGVFKYYTPVSTICTFDLNKATGWDYLGSCYDGSGYNRGILLKGKNLQIDGNGSYVDDWETRFWDEDENECVYIINILQEDGLMDRIAKALQVLVQYNTKSDGDKF